MISLNWCGLQNSGKPEPLSCQEQIDRQCCRSFQSMQQMVPVISKRVEVQAGAFRIGDTAGTLDNIVACKLHRPGSVGFVSKSGGMSNEMYNVLSRVTDGLYEGTMGSLLCAKRTSLDQFYWSSCIKLNTSSVL